MLKVFCDKCGKKIKDGWGGCDEISIRLTRIEGNKEPDSNTEIRVDGNWDICKECFNQINKPLRDLMEKLGMKLKDSEHPEGCECEECGE